MAESRTHTGPQPGTDSTTDPRSGESGFTLTEMLTYEDLGLCKKGEAKDYIASGAFELTGEVPVNTDGGLKTFGHPTGATGVRMIYENTLQLRGQAGERQVKDATLALSHNIGGAPQACGIAIIGHP